jgi:cell wall-associated NlpC family hydrolase
MLMDKLLFLFTSACLFIILLPGCVTTQHYAARKPASPPRFIDNMYMTHHDKTAVTANLIAAKRSAEKPKPEPQKQLIDNAYMDAEASIAENAAAKPAKKIESWTTARESVVIRDNSRPDVSLPGVLPTKITTPPTKTSEEGNKLARKYAGILGIENKELDNLALYQFIDKWLGTDYRLGGCDISGIDCSGFAQRLYAEIYGMDLLRTSMEQFHNCKRIKHAKDAQEGDLVFFHVHGRRISHVGVYLANNFFVHASTSQGVIISNLDEEYWHKSFGGFGRIPKPGN